MKFVNKTLIKKNQSLIFVVDALNLTFIKKRVRFLMLKNEI